MANIEATVTGDNFSAITEICRKRVYDIAIQMNTSHLSDYVSDLEYEFAMMDCMNRIHAVTAVYGELVRTMKYPETKD
jgi:hypothetical protein